MISCAAPLCCKAEGRRLADHGARGGHFMMIAHNRRQVFDVIRGWIAKSVGG